MEFNLHNDHQVNQPGKKPFSLYGVYNQIHKRHATDKHRQMYEQVTWKATGNNIM